MKSIALSITDLGWGRSIADTRIEISDKIILSTISCWKGATGGNCRCENHPTWHDEEISKERCLELIQEAEIEVPEELSKF